MHVVKIGPVAIATVPGEPTAVAAHRIERRLSQELNDKEVVVVGWSNDYSGYFTTEAEFEKQHYEGASTIYGRYSQAVLEAHLINLITSKPSALASQVEFTTFEGVDAFASKSNCGVGDPASTSPIKRSGRSINLTWRLPRDARLVFAEDPDSAWFVRVEENHAGVWSPAVHDGVPIDDIHQDVEVERCENLEDLFKGTNLWFVGLTLSPRYVPECPLRLVVAPRGKFEGIVRSIE